MEFFETLEAWYAENGRSLPWRETQDPYRVWVSEIILQQTRVDQGRDYYIRFLENFPDVQHLAAASLDSVMRVWEGLGYYSRARNMHIAAQQVVELGGFPEDYEGFRKLKGIGDYTAAALASFCRGEAKAVVDGNVYRVLSRYFGIDTPIDTTAGKREFAALAREVMDTRRSALYNQAIMDFGALQCTPKACDCLNCPLAGGCRANEEGRVEEFPRKSRRTAVEMRHIVYIVLQNAENGILIHRRNGKDIWQGLYEPLLLEPDDPIEDVAIVPAIRRWLEQRNCHVSSKKLHILGHIEGIRHQLTHRTIVADAYHVSVSAVPSFVAPEDYLWSGLEDLELYAFPKLVNRVFSRFGLKD